MRAAWRRLLGVLVCVSCVVCQFVGHSLARSLVLSFVSLESNGGSAVAVDGDKVLNDLRSSG